MSWRVTTGWINPNTSRVAHHFKAHNTYIATTPPPCIAHPVDDLRRRRGHASNTRGAEE